ncbi:DUF4956 domain-containing protein [Actinospongicola halichondriae]|uniref:DUF4956 domain-containing protein n=1 Tax=Actinospongicola halichondriae TaxID=3236844 RepID=UPI003D5AAE5D
MSSAALFAIDLIAVSVMVFGLYFPRHRRKDLVVAYLGVNVGVLAVANALNQTGIEAGLGLGLFGVLSIIRLRSTELDQDEVAYYFAALALGLLGGLSVSPEWLTPTLMVVILVVLFVGDHPRLFSNYRTQTMNLDRAFTDETVLRAHLERLLGARVHRLTVRKVDLVNDSTNVEVRYELPRATSSDSPSLRETAAVAR